MEICPKRSDHLCTTCEFPECPDWGINEIEPNNGPYDNPPTYDNIAQGETHCGLLSYNEYPPDRDWYQFEIVDETEVEFYLDGEEEHSLVLSVWNCNGYPEVIASGYTQDHCVDHTLTCTLTEAGTYSIYVSYDYFSPYCVSSSYTLTWIDPDASPTQATQPPDFHLSQNHPNPFNPSTNIEFTLPHPQEIQLVVYNIRGQRVAMLLNDVCQSGTHSMEFDAGSLPSGLYFYRLTAPGKSVTRKMILVN